MSVGPKSLEEAVEMARASGCSLVRFLYCDTSSMIRGKATSISTFADRLSTGIGLVKGMMAMNLLDQMQPDTGLGATGEVRLLPDLSTFSVLPYVDSTASVLCDLIQLDKTPWNLCPRSLLKSQIESARAMGVSIQAAFEPEFTLGFEVDGQFKPIDRGLCFSTEGMNRASRFIQRFAECLNRQGLGVEQYYPELGAGQHELSIGHTDALRACDRQIMYRETLKGVAVELGWEATLAPKPFKDQAGNGCHLHLSAWDLNEENNLFSNSQSQELSEFGRQFVAGILNHLPALVCLTCPSVNSYSRLKPGSWSSAYVCWGYENREAAVRVPTVYWGKEKETSNIEIKCVDSSCNPYLALAAVIACGLDGVRKSMKPPVAIVVDPGTMTEEERIKQGIIRLPATLHEALVELETDVYLMQTLGSEMANTFISVKSSEVSAFAHDAEFETSYHRARF